MRIQLRGALKALLLITLCALATACMQQPIEESDRSLLLTAKDLVALGVKLNEGFEANETYAKSWRPDNGTSLEYKFKIPPEQKNTLYVMTQVSIMPTALQAMYHEKLVGAGIKLGFGSSGIVESDLSGASHYGDHSIVSILSKDGHDIGNTVSIRIGNKLYRFVVSGIYIRNPKAWDKLLQPKVKALESYSAS